MFRSSLPLPNPQIGPTRSATAGPNNRRMMRGFLMRYLGEKSVYSLNALKIDAHVAGDSIDHDCAPAG